MTTRTVVNGVFNDAEYNEQGYHPEFGHLAWFDIESHHTKYIVTSPARAGSMLLSEDELVHMFGEGVEDGGYLTDEHLNQLQPDA